MKEALNSPEMFPLRCNNLSDFYFVAKRITIRMILSYPHFSWLTIFDCPEILPEKHLVAYIWASLWLQSIFYQSISIKA